MKILLFIKSKLSILYKLLAFVGVSLAALLLTVYISIGLICGNTSPSARRMFVTTILETGQLKFLASVYLSEAEIQEIVNENSMPAFNTEVDSSLIVIPVSGNLSSGQTGSNTNVSEGTGEDVKDIEIVEIPGRTFFATLMIIKDPSRLSLATIYPWKALGSTLEEIVNEAGAIAGINAGLYNSHNNSGGIPYGVVVSGGKILLNDPYSWKGQVLIGLTEDNILQIINVADMTKEQVEKTIKDMRIRDAVTFQEETSDRNNHFVQLVINGEARELNGLGSGLNPRTAIGQRADGSLLLLVTDGRGTSGHLGASASDLINIMLEYGAVNAANLDGGSSSCMYYDGRYLMTSVTFYYANSSWRMPFAFVYK